MRFHFSFIQHWKLWFVVSGLIVIIGIGGFFIRGLNYGIDFTGGTQLDLRFHQSVTTTAITNTLDGMHLSGSTVVFLGSGRTHAEITTPNVSQAERDQVLTTLSRKVGAFTKISTNRVSSVIGQETEQRALLAVVIAMAAIMLYMAIRFEWRFAVAGIAAMVHDVIITVGLIALIHIQLSQNFIMAVLTIFGYSITDKIIVFDRIRENLHTRKKNDSLDDLVNTSLNQVVVRSIYTSVTVLIALAALLVFAGSNIRDFSLTMFLGVAFGTYSSLFIASPIWMMWRKKEAPKKKRPRRSVDLEPEP